MESLTIRSLENGRSFALRLKVKQFVIKRKRLNSIIIIRNILIKWVNLKDKIERCLLYLFEFKIEICFQGILDCRFLIVI